MPILKYSSDPEVVRHLEPGDIISLTPKWDEDPNAKGIKKIVGDVFGVGSEGMQGSYTHTAMYVGGGKLVESRIGEGVQLKPLGEATKGLSYVVHRPSLPKKDRQEAAAFAKKQVGKDYDSKVLIATTLGTFLPDWVTKLVDKKIVAKPKDATAYTCANLVTAAYLKTQLTPDNISGVTTPADLLTSKLLKPVISVDKKDFKPERPYWFSRHAVDWESRNKPKINLVKESSFEDLTKIAAEKLAMMSMDARKKSQHEYYVQHRNEILQKNMAYRTAHHAELQRKQKKYYRQVKSGARKQRQRVNSGGMSFTYVGYK